MRISTLATAAGVSVDTIRYYEREGLLAPPRRTPGGMRDFDEGAVRQLRAIGRAKGLGFTLAEIRSLLHLGQEAGADARDVRAFAARRLAETEAALADLVRQRDALAELVAACGGAETTRHDCPILVDIWGDA